MYSPSTKIKRLSHSRSDAFGGRHEVAPPEGMPLAKVHKEGMKVWGKEKGWLSKWSANPSQLFHST